MSNALGEKPRTGRPRTFTDPVALQSAIDAYFLDCDAKDKPYTMAGLARTLGCSTHTIRAYEDPQRRAPDTHWEVAPVYSEAIKSARQRVEQWTEERLFGKGHPAGPIFSLKNNFGWKDVQEVQVQSRSVVLGVVMSEERRHAIAEQMLQAHAEWEQRALSPTPERLSTPSPIPAVAVTVDSDEAKATPSVGVSPRSVA